MQWFASWLLISNPYQEPNFNFFKDLDSIQGRDEGVVDHYQFRPRVSKHTGELVYCYCCNFIPSIQHDTDFLPPQTFWQMITFAVVVVQFLFEVNSNHNTLLKLSKIFPIPQWNKISWAQGSS